MDPNAGVSEKPEGPTPPKKRQPKKHRKPKRKVMFVANENDKDKKKKGKDKDEPSTGGQILKSLRRAGEAAAGALTAKGLYEGAKLLFRKKAPETAAAALRKGGRSLRLRYKR